MTAGRKNALAFILGVGAQIQMRVVGTISPSEFVCVFVTPWVFSACYPEMRRTRLRPILILSYAWLGSGIITDFLYRHTDLLPALKGLGAILCLICAMICCYGLFRDDIGRLKYYIVGAMISSALATLKPTSYQQFLLDMGGDPGAVFSFKVQYAPLLAEVTGLLIALTYGRWPVAALACGAVGATIALLNGARAVFLCTMAGVLLAAFGRWAFPTLRRVQRSTGMILILSALLVFAAGKIYKMAALSGIMGEDEYRKYSLQSKSKIGLLSGRTEVVTGLMAIGDSPILGHGSWPWDEKQYRRQTMEMIGALDMLDEYMTRVRQLGVFEYIPTHSHFVQAWVWHGFLGGVFWIYVLIFLFRFFCDGIHLYRPLLAWFAIVYLSAIWALIFSPISSRFSWGVLISVAALGLAEAERRRRMRLAGIPLDPDAPWDGRPSASPFA